MQSRDKNTYALFYMYYICQNIVFPAQAENSYFSDEAENILVNILIL